MWLTRETDDEYIVRGVPVFFWLGGIFFLGIGVDLLLRNAGSFLVWAKPAEKPYETFLLAASLFFMPAIGLGLFAFAPFITTVFNRRAGIIFYSSYGLLRIDRRRIEYENLDGGVRVKAEDNDDDGGSTYSIYFKLKSGERLRMCAEPGQIQGRNYDVGMKANEFLRKKQLAQSNQDVITLDLT